jgi:hypothetical protein
VLLLFTFFFLVFLRNSRFLWWQVLLFSLFVYAVYLVYKFYINEDGNGFVYGFSSFGKIFSNAINFVLLFFVYFIGVGITAFFARLSEKHFLDTRKKDSYWSKISPVKNEFESYFRQF